MSQELLPSDVAAQVAAALDDNVNVPVGPLLQFEQALHDNPSDAGTRQVYRDWLLEHGCDRRARQLERGLQPGEPDDYTGPLRPTGRTDWSRL
jgi:uncharacterized protein (TIGR02996 family)